MYDIRFDGKFEFILDNIGFVNAERNENHIFEYKNGKDRFSFIFVEKGSLEYTFASKKHQTKELQEFYYPNYIPAHRTHRC